MSTVNVEQVRDSLKKCMDPEVPLSIVDMGLIYGIDVTDNNDVNIKSAYICCRNDAIGNILIIFSAYLVYSWGTNWPDVIAGLIIASIFFITSR